jgi:hypothetical protein
MELWARTRKPRCGLDVFAPARDGRPKVGGTGLSRVRIERAAGDWRVEACVRGKYSVNLR